MHKMTFDYQFINGHDDGTIRYTEVFGIFANKSSGKTKVLQHRNFHKFILYIWP